MKLRKTFRTVLCSVFAIIIAFSGTINSSLTIETNASTGNYWYIDGTNDSYLWDKGDYDTYNFSFNQKSDLTIYMYTYDDFIIRLYKSNGTLINSYYSNYYNYSYEFTKTGLAKGNYYVQVINDEYYDSLDYDLSLYGYCKINPTSIKLNKKKLTLSVNNGYYLTPTLKPTGASGTISYTSSNKKIATVSSDGYVYGKKLGKTVITAKVAGKKAKCTVYVTKADYIEYKKGSTANIKNIFKYVKGYKKAKWVSTKPKVISVNKGKITCKAHGSAYIYIKSGGKKYKVKVYSYDKVKLKKKTIAELKDTLYVPHTLKVNTVKYYSFKRVRIYYSALNRSGEKRYGDVIGYYDNGKHYWYSN